MQSCPDLQYAAIVSPNIETLSFLAPELRPGQRHSRQALRSTVSTWKRITNVPDPAQTSFSEDLSSYAHLFPFI
jgi:hypothetical protein